MQDEVNGGFFRPSVPMIDRLSNLFKKRSPAEAGQSRIIRTIGLSHANNSVNRATKLLIRKLFYNAASAAPARYSACDHPKFGRPASKPATTRKSGIRSLFRSSRISIAG
jgi:hypothetical protein